MALVAVGLIAVPVISARAADRTDHADKTAIAPREEFSTFLAGQQVALNYEVDTSRLPVRSLGWSLSIDRRTLSRGEVDPRVSEDGRWLAAVRLHLPEVKKGLAIETRLAVQAYDDHHVPIARHERPIWIFSPDPFVHRSTWLEELEISLFDPEDNTAEVLKSFGVPFERVHNPAALEDVTGKLVIIGEGTSFAKHLALPEVMMRLAARGISVVCLAPSAGVVPLPSGALGGLPSPDRLVFRRQDAITALDKRLDAKAWPPDGVLVANSLSIESDRSRVVARVSDSRQGWPWIEMHYPDQGATLLICGFGIIERWDAGPTPRYLFARMLEFVSREPRQNGIGSAAKRHSNNR